MKQTKKDIYAAYGISYDRKVEKIYHNTLGWIKPILINGNGKLGRGVWTYSTLATNKMYIVSFGPFVDKHIKGTCPCHCDGCYATKGRYTFDNVIRANAIKTWLSRYDIDFMTRAIIAQINADHIKICRIHASGDFDSPEYIAAWRTIVKESENTVFWTYTKNLDAENAFNDLSNINVVRSIIPGIGFNFGHCDYIIRVYKALRSMGKKVYICRCGIDKTQHCTNCHGCYENEIVLFVEHSTEYKAEKDPAYNELKQLIESQDITIAGKAA